MQLACEVCHEPLHPDDVRMDLAVARCQSCNAVYDLSGRKGRGRSSQAPEKPRRVRAQTPLPSHFKVAEQALERRLGIEDAPVSGELFVRNPAV